MTRRLNPKRKHGSRGDVYYQRVERNSDRISVFLAYLQVFVSKASFSFLKGFGLFNQLRLGIVVTTLILKQRKSILIGSRQNQRQLRFCFVDNQH